MITFTETVVDVTGRVGIDGEHHIAVSVFAPVAPLGTVPLLFCLPGGTYTREYWHLEVEGRPGYSFAAHLASQGMMVVAVDHLGTGSSSRHPRAVELTPDVVAGVNAAACADVVSRARSGMLVPDLGPVELGPVVGVGHSMGGMLLLVQQSLHESFDAIAPLGFGTIGPIVDFGADGLGVPSNEAVMSAAREGAFDEPILHDRSRPEMRHHFHWDDVPADVIAADDRTNTYLPGVSGLLCIVPFIATDHAGRITCPVFLGFGERDSAADYHEEPRSYRASPDITLFVLGRSAHCHNTAGTRHVLWDRLARWVRAL